MLRIRQASERQMIEIWKAIVSYLTSKQIRANYQPSTSDFVGKAMENYMQAHGMDGLCKKAIEMARDPSSCVHGCRKSDFRF